MRNNRIHDNGSADGGGGIIVSAGDNNVAYNNLIYKNRDNGIDVWYYPTNTKVYNNTIYANYSQPISVYQASDTRIYNNIMYQNGNDGIEDLGDNSGTVVNSNLTANPRFVNPTSGDFRLQPDSPAIDAGMALPEVTTDFAGTPRPQGNGFDLGAYEFRSGGPTPLRGDLNGDGKRDLADVRLLIYMLLGQQATTPEADLTGDGAVTLADVQALIRLMVGLP